MFEKAGVNVSVVQGALPPEALQHMKARGKDFGEPPFEFKAMGKQRPKETAVEPLKH